MTRQSWSLINQSGSTEQKQLKQNISVNNLPVGEITDSGRRAIDDSKDVRNHVSIEAVGVFHTLLTPFTKQVLTLSNKENSKCK